MRMGAFVVATCAMLGAASAQDFYEGRTIELVVSTGLGSAVDTNARLVARFLPAYIPGRPNIVVRNMPGAAHKRAANFLFNQAARDGTSMGALNAAFALAQVLDARGVQYDAAKFAWLGSTASANVAIVASATHVVKTLDDARKWPLLMGATGSASAGALYPTALNNLLGTKFRILTTYATTEEISAALERREIEGRAGQGLEALKTRNPEGLRAGHIRVLAQVGLERDPDFPDAPLIAEAAANTDDRAILHMLSTDAGLGRVFLMPPETPLERTELLRKALMDTLRDPDFQNGARAAGLDVRPRDGASVQKIVQDLVATRPDLVARAKAAMQPRDFVENGNSAADK